MKPISVRHEERVLTVVSLYGGWLRLVEARLPEQGPAALLGMKARRTAGLNDVQAAAQLKEMAASLPVPAREALALISTEEMVTRYLTLPSEKPEELRRMAAFQLEGALPFPAQECVTSVKVIGPAGEATRVLAAAVHRPAVERILRICSQAGFSVRGIACSSEAVASWHRACWPSPRSQPDVWLVADRSREGLDIGVLVKGSLVYMRQVPHAGEGVEDLSAQIHETLQAYAREQVGPPVQQISVSGWMEGLAPRFAEQVELMVGTPVRRVDPLERSPFRQALSVTAQELSPEISFTDLLGAACTPRLLGLDLLPLEIREQQQRQEMARDLRATAALAAAALALAVVWAGARTATAAFAIRGLAQEIAAIEPDVTRVRSAADEVRQIARSRVLYSKQMRWLGGAMDALSGGMKLQFLGLDAKGSLTVRGTAPDLPAVTGYAAALQGTGLWESVNLRSAKSDPDRGQTVEFEMVMRAE